MKFTIRMKFIVLIIVIVAIANLSVSISTTNLATTVIQSSTRTNMKNQANTAARLIDDVIKQEFSLLNGLAQIPDIGNPDISLTEKTELLTTIRNMDPKKYNAIGYCDSTGQSMVGDSLMDFSNQDLYKNAAKGKRYASEPSESTFQPGAWLMYFSVPVKRDGQFQGAVLSVVEGNALDEITSSIDIGGGYHPMVIDRNTSQIIGMANRTDTSAVTIDEKTALGRVVQTVLMGTSGYTTYMDEETGKEMIISYCPIEDTTTLWSVICVVPAEIYHSGITTIKQTSMGSLAGTLVFSVLFAAILIALILKPLKNVTKSMDDIAGGNADLTKRIPKTTKDEIGHLVTGFNSFTEKMQTIMIDIHTSNKSLTDVGEALDASTSETDTSIQEITRNINDIHHQIEVQSQSVHETAGAVNEIASNIESLEKMISKQADGVSGASSAVEKMIGNINSVNTSMDQMAYSFTELTDSAHDGSLIQEEVNNQIEEIRQQSQTLEDANIAIASIAEQTNLLAMNAAIEAAHAGEAGKGFSVVADEIRKLSETSSEQSRTIGNHLTEIRASIQNVVEACKKSTQAFETMSDKIGLTDQVVKQIKNVMEEQTESSRQINATLHSMNDSTQEVRVASQEMAQGNKAILEEVSILQDATDVMKKTMETMSDNAKKITVVSSSLTDISGKMRHSIQDIGTQLDQFKV